MTRNTAYNKALDKIIRQRFAERRCVVCSTELVEQTHTFCAACFRRTRHIDRAMLVAAEARKNGKFSSDGKHLRGGWLRAVRVMLKHLREPQPEVAPVACEQPALLRRQAG